MINNYVSLKAKASHLWTGMRRIMIGVILPGLLISSCAPGLNAALIETPADLAQPHTASPEPTITPAPVLDEIDLPQETQSDIFLSYPNLDGNRVVEGDVFNPNNPVDIQLMGKPIWVVAAALQDQSIWYVVLETGQVQVFLVEGRVVVEEEQALNPFLPPGMPPALAFNAGQFALLTPESDAAIFTNPLLLEDGSIAYVGQDRRILFSGNDEIDELPVNVLPDARILSDGDGRLMVLSGPSDIYPHSIMGDELEATAITILDTSVTPLSIQDIRITTGDVIEGLAPIWVDMDGDGHREIVVTQSNAIEGSRIVVYNEDGTVLAQGAPVGQGFRWIHQVAVGQFIEGGSLEIATVRTPHIGGIVEIYALDGDQLVVMDSLSGYSSHRIGSRNLDGGLAGDFNGDGLIELVVPDQAQTNLHGIQYAEGQLTSVWDVPLGKRLSTNLAVLQLPDGRVALGAGTENQLLRIWVP
jgi:hypothetical protein